jgi:hypothetical protein
VAEMDSLAKRLKQIRKDQEYFIKAVEVADRKFVA